MRQRSQLAAFFLAALVLRPQLVGIGPLLPEIRHDLDVSHAAAGSLGTIPILCMGLFALPARYIAGRFGSRIAVASAVGLVGVFGILRPLPHDALGVILLTFPIGIGMGLAGALLPVIVKERFADRPGFATAFYATGIAVGAAAADAAAIPLAHLGGSWGKACGTFGLVSVGLGVCWVALTRDKTTVIRTDAQPLRLPFRSVRAWHLVAAFLFMSSVFYGVNTWLPAAYVDRGWHQTSAGELLALMNAVTIPCGFAVAWAADHWGARYQWLTAAACLEAAALIGFITMPGAAWAWGVMLGLGIGPLFPLTMTLPLDVASDPAEAAALTAMMLGAGYTLSAIAPVALGIVRDRTGGFSPVLWSLVAGAVILVGVDAALALTLPKSAPREQAVLSSRDLVTRP